MKPPGKTTLTRMQLAALSEQERIEISQDGRVSCGMQKKPLPSQVRLRDDFAGIVRLIDMINSDRFILERLDEISKRAPALAPAEEGLDDEAVDA